MKVKIENLSKSFGTKHVLKNINIEIAPCESLVIIGGSGSGKSVFLKNLLGLIKPDSGNIYINDIDIIHGDNRDRAKIMRKLGMLFQGGALFDSLTVWENISFALLNREKIPKKQAFDIAIENLEKVGLAKDVAYMYPAELSGGMQKRVALARAIAVRPEIILFDEPTTGLDPIMSDVINNLIIKCSRELGATTITITHDMSSVKKIASKVAMLYKGEFIWQGTNNQLENSGNPYIEQFVNGKAEGPIQMEVSLR